MVLIDNVVPVFLVAALGYIAGKTLRIDGKSVSRVALYILTPALVFNSLSTADIMPGEFLVIVSSAAALIIIMTVLGAASARLAGLPPLTATAVTIGSGFMNAGNYGLPVTLFALGQGGFDRAVIFMVVMSVATNSLGVFVCARGRGGTKEALRSVVGMPALYAALLGLMFQINDWRLPLALARPVEMLAGASVPLFLVVLGIQLSSVKMRPGFLKAVSLTTFLRLIVSPLVALGFTALIGIGGLTQKAIILEAAMPCAVNSSILASEYDTEPELASSNVMVTTVLSIITLTVVIMLIMR